MTYVRYGKKSRTVRLLAECTPSCGGAVDVCNDKAAEIVAVLHECLALVASEAICVPFVQKRDDLGELEGTVSSLNMEQHSRISFEACLITSL